MKQDEIIRMAREAGFAASWTESAGEALQRFAALVAAAEREACAKLAEMAEPYQTADLIRKRGQE